MDLTKKIDVRSYIQENYHQYTGDESFLAPATLRTQQIWQKVQNLLLLEQQKGILDLDTKTPSSITSHAPGYIDQANEIILGLQTDAPLKRAIKPKGGIRFVEKAAESYGYKVDPEVTKIFTQYRKTHNDGVFDAYTDEIRLFRSKSIITGLPDNYGRGRIIGDYRRLPLYGTDTLISEKRQQLATLSSDMTEENIRLREEIAQQITALQDIAKMSLTYGFDVFKPATDSKEAIQWLYLAFLAACKEQDGAAMSLGRIDAFLDIYIEKDLAIGKYTETQIQEMIDDFVIKLRIIRHLRAPEYNQLFAGDPTWVTVVLGGTGIDGRSMVTKTSFRILHSLSNLGPAPEPNLTVVWGANQPLAWKKFCASQSIKYSSIQYENDDLMKEYYGDDYAIACCVSGMKIGSEMQFFGARANLVKALLLAINDGREEPMVLESELGLDIEDINSETNNKLGGDEIISGLEPINTDPYLNYEKVWNQYMIVLDKLAELYVNTMNIIHYMHDKYYYEAAEMAFHDIHVKRWMAFGIAGLSIVADSLSAIKYAKVKPILNSRGVAERYEVEGDFPKYGNDDERVDSLAVEVTKQFINKLRKHKCYRDAIHTLSVLTITSNVVYGKATGATPDGREIGIPFAPGANPMHGRDQNGAIASLNSVAKIDYCDCQDGISNTFSIIPDALGKDPLDQITNLVQLLDGYFIGKKGHHLNVNVFTRETLLEAQKHPELFPQLTIRVSGYAVLFNRLSKEQQDEVIARTFHVR